MIPDMIERLRRCHGINSGDPECYCAEAAEEIERLHDSLEDVYREVKRLMDENACLLAERERLQAQIEQLRWDLSALQGNIGRPRWLRADKTDD